MSARSRGYTIVELMMAIAVLGIGIMGVIAMQKVTISSNGHAKRLATATHIAQSWLDELAAEAGQWNDENDFDETIWLTNVGVEGAPPNDWFLPVYNAGRDFGPAFDAVGSPVATDDIPNDARYCTELRLRWIVSQNAIKAGGGLIRAEARVFWRRQGVVSITAEQADNFCQAGQIDLDTAEAQRMFHIVYLSTALRQHIGVPD
jgi:prepilin-type N-terminal cleavage/methylation domain-containing protein